MRTFSLFIHNADSTTPTLMMEVASDLDRVRTLAQAALAASTRRLAVEVREDDHLVFSLDRNGVSWGGSHGDLSIGNRAFVPRDLKTLAGASILSPPGRARPRPDFHSSKGDRANTRHGKSTHDRRGI